MSRLIQESIKKPLAEQILFGDLAELGGTVFVTVEEDKLKFEFVPTKEPADQSS